MSEQAVDMHVCDCGKTAVGVIVDAGEREYVCLECLYWKICVDALFGYLQQPQNVV